MRVLVGAVISIDLSFIVVSLLYKQKKKRRIGNEIREREEEKNECPRRRREKICFIVVRNYCSPLLWREHMQTLLRQLKK